jgi:hypothetical protein
MKPWVKVLIILTAMIAALSAYFWLKPDVIVEKTEGTASIDLSGQEMKEEPIEEKNAEVTPLPELGGFSGLENELDALMGAM